MTRCYITQHISEVYSVVDMIRYDSHLTCSSLFWQIWAGLPAGSLVTNVFAKDLDAGENGTVTFSLVTGEF